MEMFIFSIDKIGTRILDALKRAAGRGVDVKLIVDGIGSPGFTNGVIAGLKEDLVDVRVYNPINSFFYRLQQHILRFKWNKIFKLFNHMNRRNHRKVVVIDSTVAWVGSANISDSYLNWRETMIRVTGINVSEIIAGFRWMWTCSTVKMKGRMRPQINFCPTVCHNFTWLNQSKVRRFKISLLRQAKSSIKISNPYFIPPYHLLIPLLKARKRGVEVTLITSKVNDVFFVKWFCQSYYKTLLHFGIKVYERREKFLHSKILMVDDKRAIVGTSNYNYRSVHWDLEIDLLVNKSETLKSLNKKWEEDLSESDQIIKPSMNFILSWILKRASALRKIS